MKKLLYILLATLLIGCNPFISKDLRNKNKCNRKLAKIVEKCPSLIKEDTLTIKFDTTIVTNEVKVDSLVFRTDTISMVKDKFHVKIIHLRDSVLIQGGCLADTIYIDKIIKVPYQQVQPIQLTIFEQFQNFLSRFLWWVILAFILFLSYKIVSKRFF